MSEILVSNVVLDPPRLGNFLILAAWVAIGVEIFLTGWGVKKSLANSARITSKICISAGASLLVATLAGWLVAAVEDLGPIFGIALIAAWRIVCAYSKTSPKLPLLTKAILITPGILVIALIATWLCNPQTIHARYEKLPATILVGVDTSKSMDRADVQTKSGVRKTRIQAVRDALKKNSDLLKSLREKNLKLRFFQFADELNKRPSASNPASWASEIHKPDALSTSIGDSIAEAVEPLTSSGENVQSIIIFSDGCNNRIDKISPIQLARLLADQQIKLYPVAVGASIATGVTKALTIQSLDVPESVTAFATMNARPVISAIGLAGKKVKITATFGDKKIGEQIRTIPRKRWAEQFDFTHIPLEPGFHRLTIAIELLGNAGQKIAGRRYDSRLVQVTNRELRILYIEGRFRYETKYIARALSSSKRIKLHRKILLGNGASGAASLGESEKDWLGYHAIILGDVSADNFSPEQIAIMKKLVTKYGKGLCMIGGQKSFGRGGWQFTPLADVMPIDLSRSTGEIKTPVKPLPTRDGLRAGVMKISDNLSVAKAWEALDAMPGANKLLGVKPAATVLAKTTAGDLMIVTQRSGKGRVVAIAFDTTWRWALSPSELDTGEMQQRFWRQLALYLCALRGNAWLSVEKSTYDLADLKKGARVEISAGIANSQGVVPKSQPAVVVTIFKNKKKIKSITLIRDGDEYRGHFSKIQKPGIYDVELTTKVDGQNVKATQQFEVIKKDRESSELLANKKLLARLGRITRGRAYEVHDFAKLIEKIKAGYTPATRKIVRRESLFGAYRWWFVLAMIGLMIIQWIARRKKGLV